MTEENRLKSIEKKIDEQSREIKVISDTLSVIAVQEERMKHIESQMHGLWKKYDMMTDPNNGTLPAISRHQASCPRHQIKFLWWFVATVDFGLLVMLLSLLFRTW